MAYGAPPKFHGRITITAGSNDKIDWYETDGTPANISTTVTAGTYYIGDGTEAGTLAKLLADAMTTRSAAVGRTLTYTSTVSDTTGQLTITCAGGTWYPKITGTEVDKILNGGAPSANGEVLDNHLGFYRDSAYPSDAASHTSDICVSHCWYPDQPYFEHDESSFESSVIESITLGGSVNTFDFVGTTYDSDGSGIDTLLRTCNFHFLSDDARVQYLFEFWHPYAKQGLPDGRFRFFPDRTDEDTYEESGLTGEALKKTEFRRTVKGIKKWNIMIRLRRY